ncbi:hypothetical protein PYW08_015786 [Mythimna loreyi]|uniref:Uncharacterized protein n=1 Tax=Mythimna loreyi TaxID=667449 RepID=A0ACC2QRM6_9NEOP|nr:hypothetical protein PYW08_015786 [Mythimna loreyi]
MEGLPYGQFPLYEEDGRVLTQSLAIAKYVARDTELIPADAWQRAVVESAVYTLFDYWRNVPPYYFEADPAKKEELRKKLFVETIDYYFSRISKQLSENGGYFNVKLSWGEFFLTGIVEASNRFLQIELEKQYPVVGATVVKEYIKTRGVYKLPPRIEVKNK